jgi:hypothetical protein
MALADEAKQVTDRDLLTIVHQVRRGNIAAAKEPGINATAGD